MEKNNFRIHIKIDTRTYPLDIRREDEEKYRLAAKMVNDTVRRFRGLFLDNDSQDILAMSAFQIALSAAETKKSEEKALFIVELKNLNDDISDFLKEKRKKSE